MTNKNYKIDMTGKKYGRLIVLSYAGKKPRGKELVNVWNCQCECGNHCVVVGSDLRNGTTQSCGCLHKDIVGNINKKHNLSCGKCGNRLYDLWKSIKYRCYNKNNKSYSRYGGRGIKVCDEWLHDFKAFYDWALANGYRDEKLPNGLNKWTIDRIDNNKGYSPENCRFITNQEQSLNKRNTIPQSERFRICPVCGKQFEIKQRKGQKTCSHSCGAKYRGKEYAY